MQEVFRNKESELIRDARRVFRDSVAGDLFGVLTNEDMSKFESWFINRSIEKYWEKVGGFTLIDSEVSMLNYSVVMTVNKLYAEGFVSTTAAIGSWHERRSSWILNALEREVGISERTISECPSRLEEIEEFSEKLVSIFDKRLGLVIRSAFEGLGMSIGYCVLGVGAVSGAVGYVIGKTVRTSGEALISRLSGKK